MTASPVTVTAPATAVRPRARRWSTRYARRLAVTDAVVVAGSVLACHLLWLGTSAVQVPMHGERLLRPTYPQLSLVLAVVWLALLAAFDSRDEREVGSGSTEYRRVLRTGFAVFGVTIVAGFFLGLDLSRAWVLAVFP